MFADNMKNWQLKLMKWLHSTYFHPTCDFCHNELIMSYDEAKITLFEPVTKDIERIEIDRDAKTGKVKGMHNVTKPEIVSSDPKKDTFTFKCPYCGHIFTMTREELYKLKCSFYGDNNKRFELTELETQLANEFIKEHNHKEEFRKQNKFGFSTLGQQFTYEITPGGLGSGVVIKCNHCGATKDITDTDSW